MPRKSTDRDGSLEILFDPEAQRALLLHPDRAFVLRSPGRRPRLALARAGLSVIAVSGLCLLPAASRAGSSGAVEPVVSAACAITGTLADGTPSGVLGDGSACVRPPASAAAADESGPAPAPAQNSEPATETRPAPEPAPAPKPAPKPAPAPAGPVAPAGGPPASEPPTTEDVPLTGGDAPVPASDPPPAATGAGSAQPPAGASAYGPPTPPVGGPSPRPASAPAAPSDASPAAREAGSREAPVLRVRSPRPARTSLRLRPAPRDGTDRAAAPTAGTQQLPALGMALAPTLYVSDEAVIPRFLIKLFKAAGRRYDLPWPILAAINEIETDFGRNVAVSSAGAVGWMQFMPATWRAYGVDADRDGVKDPDDPHDAIFAAARYLHASGARRNLRRAIFAYNHAGWYVDSVLLRAERIAAQQGERNRRLSRVFRASTRRLERQVLSDPRITLYECGRRDIERHRIDRRVLVALRFLAWSGLHPTVTSLECGHGYYTKSGNVSHHSSGNAVDIAAINGIPILGHQGPGSVTEATIRELLTLRGAMRPDQIISLMTFEGADNTVAMADHADHIHLGFRPLRAEPLAPRRLVGPAAR